MAISKFPLGSEIKKLEDILELTLLKEGDRVLIYYNEAVNEGPTRNSNIAPDLVYGDYKNFDMKFPGYGGITLTDSLELDVKFRKINEQTINFLENLRQSKIFDINKEKHHYINGFYNSPNAFGIYLIRKDINTSK
ncbi:hypothetical protein GW932_02175 [archaeon]|nr:hypothetical protein [archaeon]